MSQGHSQHKPLATLPQEYVGTTGSGTPQFPIPKEVTPWNSLNQIIAFARLEKVNDIHFSAGEPIIFRKLGQLKKTSEERLTAQGIEALLKSALPKEVMDEALHTGDKEFVYGFEGIGRCRMTIIRQRLGIDATIRLIPMSIPSFAESGMPESCMGLTKWSQGLILIAGPAGCGKTTTLSVLVEMINQSRQEHIITIESPIEIVYKPAKCQFSQREIKLHTHNQHNALRAAMREDPDVIIISELRDLDTIQLAISAAETGHLVLGTMNTLSATQTISRVTDSFPADEQPIIRNMLSESLRGIICQQLIPTVDGKSVVPAYEVLMVNQPVANLIREGRIGQISNTMTTGKAAGMVLMDNSIKQLLADGKITMTQARERVKNLQVLM
jgi:twitching motility protein PilT